MAFVGVDSFFLNDGLPTTFTGHPFTDSHQPTPSTHPKTAMGFKPLLEAREPIPVHAFAAMAAFFLGLVQITGPKGTAMHRAIGWAWVTLMMLVAVSSFWIHEVRTWGLWSPIHLLSIFTLVMLPLGVWRARTKRICGIRGHKWTMIQLFVGALVIAGGFTFYPGRIMHSVVYGSK